MQGNQREITLDVQEEGQIKSMLWLMVYFSDDNAGAGEWSPRHPALAKIDTALTGC